MNTEREYLEGCVTLCKRRRERLRREAAKAKRRGDMHELARIRRAMVRNLDKIFEVERRIRIAKDHEAKIRRCAYGTK